MTKHKKICYRLGSAVVDVDGFAEPGRGLTDGCKPLVDDVLLGVVRVAEACPNGDDDDGGLVLLVVLLVRECEGGDGLVAPGVAARLAAGDAATAANDAALGVTREAATLLGLRTVVVEAVGAAPVATFCNNAILSASSSSSLFLPRGNSMAFNANACYIRCIKHVQ
jgi:hypothetical protein